FRTVESDLGKQDGRNDANFYARSKNNQYARKISRIVALLNSQSLMVGRLCLGLTCSFRGNCWLATNSHKRSANRTPRTHAPDGLHYRSQCHVGGQLNPELYRPVPSFIANLPFPTRRCRSVSAN